MGSAFVRGTRRLLSKAGKAALYSARAARWEALARLRSTVTVSTRQGRFTVFTRDQAIGRWLYCFREFESELVRDVARLLAGQGRLTTGSVGTVLDIGANMGITSITLLRAGVAARALAIEPDPRNFGLLERNALQNDLADRVHPRMCALSERTGTVEMELSGSNFGDHRIRLAPPPDRRPELYRESSRHVVRVRCERLDDLADADPAFDDVGLAWIDVQGHEGHVFRGGRSFFSRDIPVVAELWPYGLRRAGLAPDEFCELAASLWPAYYMRRRGRWIRYPMATLGLAFEELGDDGEADNVVFGR